MNKINLILKIDDKVVTSSEWETELTRGEEIEAHWFATAVSDVIHFKNYRKYRDWIADDKLKRKLKDSRKMIKELLNEYEN